MDFALPLEFENRMKNLLQEEWEDFLGGYLDDRYQALRFHPAKVDSAQETAVFQLLSGSDRQPERIPWAAHAYYYEDPMRPGRHPYHEMGLYYIQEPSAMSAAALLAPLPGMRVLDLCAAPGGKTTQLAGLLQNQGLLVANEINSARCRILSQNVERLGIPNCIVTNEDSGTMAEHFPSYFHAILVDAPCSGEGMFRKNPQAITEWSPSNVTMCAARQAEILDNAAGMLLPGGHLVYSTCTFAPEENEQTISAFLDRHPDFHVGKADFPWFSRGEAGWGEGLNPEVADTFRLWPHRLHGEGHYAALLIRDGKLPDYRKEQSPAARLLPSASTDLGESPSNSRKKQNTGKGKKNSGNYSDIGAGTGFSREMRGKKGKKDPHGSGPAGEKALLTEFLRESLTQEAADQIATGPQTLFGSQLYLLPCEGLSFQGLHVMRAGLQVGEFCKNRFEPSHALALALKPDQVRNVFPLSLEDPRTNAFFRGESLMMSPEEQEARPELKGWTLVTVDGFPAGWGKASGGMIKNHYPKGLRFDFSSGI